MERFRRFLALTTCLPAALIASVPVGAFANPQDGVVVGGSATISSSGNKLDVHQTSDRAFIDWRTFNIDAGEWTEFHQPNSNSIALNRVTTGGASTINGKLTANGNVVIINQNGVMFGSGAQVDVNGLVASTSGSTVSNFMNGGALQLDQRGNNPNATISNEGQITAKEAGLVGFVAPNVENSGVITANLGRIHLASGDSATVDLYGDGLMEVGVSDAVTSQLVKNTGTLQANGGKIAITAAAGQNIVNSLLNVQGTLQAQTVGVHKGTIIIGAEGSNAVAGNVSTNKGKKSGSSKVNIAASIDASGQNSGEKGGSLTVYGDEITVLGNTRVNTSGDTGGGSIKIGGDYYGIGSTPAARQLIVHQGALFDNSAITQGNAGSTVFWSDGSTYFAGRINAMGGAYGGDGGFAEVSGHDWLGFEGFADLSALQGDFGTLLLDPTDITISANANSNSTNTSGTFTGSAGTSNINVSTLTTQLASSNVIVNSTSGTGGNGDITVNSAINWTSTRTLTLTATRDVFINAAITSSGIGSAFAATGRDIIFNANVSNSSASGAGNITATATRDLTIASGVTLATGAAGALSLRAAGGNTLNTGLFTNNGTISVGTGLLTLLSGLSSVDSSRTNYSLTSGNFIQQGANVGTLNITGFNDISLGGSLTSTHTIGTTSNISAARDITFSGTHTRTGTGAIIYTAGRDIWVNNSISTGTSNYTAGRDINIASTRTLTGTGMIINAAGANIANTGQINLNGSVAVTTGLNLVTGLSSADGSRQDINFDGSKINLNSGVAITSLTASGYRDITLSSGINTSSNATLTAERNLTINSGVTATNSGSGTLTLAAAGGNTANTGQLSLNGGITLSSTSSLSLVNGLSSVDASRSNLTVDSNLFTISGGGSAISAFNISGYQDITFNRTFTSATSTVTASRDIFFNSATVTKSSTGTDIWNARDIIFSNNAAYTRSGTTGGTTFNASRNITINSGSTLTMNSLGTLNLNAAGGSSSGTGLLTNNGVINHGAGFLNLVSGFSATDGTTRNDFSLGNSSFTTSGSALYGFNISGFRDINFAKAITFGTSGNTSIAADRDININFALTHGNFSNPHVFTAGRDINFNADFTNSSSSTSATSTFTAGRNLTIPNGITVRGDRALTLNAAGGDVNGTGLLTLDGRVTQGFRELTMVSGRSAVDGTTRSDLTLDDARYSVSSSYIGSLNISGFDDVTLNRSVSTSIGMSNLYSSTISAYGDIYINSGFVGNSGTVPVQLSGRDIRINSTLGNSAMSTITANASRDFYIGFGGSISANSNITLVAGSNFYNSATGTPITSSTGRWLIYSQNADNNTLGSLTASFKRYGCTYGGSCPSFASESGNGFLYSYSPTLNVNIQNIASANTTYGDATSLSGVSYQIDTAGYLGTDATDDVRTGTASLSTAYTQGSDFGYYDVTFDTKTFSSKLGYTFNYVDATGTNGLYVAKRTLTAMPTATISKVYDGSRDAIFNNSQVTLGNFYNTDQSSLTVNSVTATLDNKNVGDAKSGVWSAISLTGAKANNYTISGAVSNAVNVTARDVSVASIVADNKVYDGTRDAVLDHTNTYLSGKISGDNLVLDTSAAAGIFDTKNVGTSKTVTLSGYSVSGSDLGNYNFIAPTSTTANITVRDLLISALASDKTYDGTRTASVTLDSDKISGDVLTLANTGALFDTKNVGTDKTVTVSGLSISGTDASNYNLVSNSTTATADISLRNLLISALASDKTYDGTRTASVTLDSDKISGDVLTLANTGALFDTKNVGTDKTVTVSGLSISGTDASNYNLVSNSTTATADIIARGLTVNALVSDRVYDGTTSADAVLGSNKIAGDNITLAYTNANFADKNVGVNKTATVSGIGISGGDANNYNLLNTTATDLATISSRGITLSATAGDKTYDGTTTATGINLSSNKLSGDSLDLNYTSANFANKNAATSKTVMVSGLGITGSDADNYHVISSNATTTASIFAKALSLVGITVADKVYDKTTTANLVGGSLVGVVSGDTVLVNRSSVVANFDDYNAGEDKAVTASGFAINNANYTLSQPTGLTGTILARNLYITAQNGQSKTYGDANPASYTYQIASGSLVSGDNLSGALTRVSGENVGNYAIQQGSLSAGNNYNVHFTGRNFVINPYTLTASLTGTVSKIADGTRAATLAANNYQLTSALGSDIVVLNNPSNGLYDTPEVGTGKLVSVNGLQLSGAAASNYRLDSNMISGNIGEISAAQATSPIAGLSQANIANISRARTIPVPIVQPVFNAPTSFSVNVAPTIKPVVSTNAAPVVRSQPVVMSNQHTIAMKPQQSVSSQPATTTQPKQPLPSQPASATQPQQSVSSEPAKSNNTPSAKNDSSPNSSVSSSNDNKADQNNDDNAEDSI